VSGTGLPLVVCGIQQAEGGGGCEILEEKGKKEYGNRKTKKNVKESSRGLINEGKLKIKLNS
jgi:hypothetical protein